MPGTTFDDIVVDAEPEQLVGLFAFDLHPYSLNPLSARDRHAQVARPLLESFGM